jgi:hypothetical protein
VRVNPHKLSAILFIAVTLAVSAAIMLIAMSGGRADHLPYTRGDGVIIYGDYGLYRPGHLFPWQEGPLVIGAPRYGAASYFFPTNRDDPGAYRRRPAEKGGIRPPEPYYRSWGAQSENPDPARATQYAPFDPPAVIYAPRIGPQDHDKK